MQKFRKPFLFTICILPFAIFGSFFAVKYSFSLIDPKALSDAIKQIGSESALIAISMLQSVALTLIAAFFGYIVSEKVCLMRKFEFDGETTRHVIQWSIVGGFVLSWDPWVFGRYIPSLTDYYVSAGKFDMTTWIASIVYGGITEELLMRLFFMSIMAMVVWKAVYADRTIAPHQSLIAANFVAAFLFAAGHLPITAAMFGGLTPMLLLRCFLLNGGAGLLFGRFYRQYGIQYAMLSHMIFHIISRIIWLIAF